VGSAKGLEKAEVARWLNSANPRLWLGLCLLVQMGLLPWVWDLYVVGDFNDDGSYLALSRSLARGLTYQDLFELGAPAQVRFPPGYPLVLAPLQGLFPQALWLARLQSVCFSLAALGVFVGYCGRLGLGEAALILAANVYWAFSGTTVMSEALFTLALVLYLRQLERVGEGGARSLFVLGLAAALCYFIRAVGLVLVPTTLLWRWRRDGRGHGWFLLAFCLGAGPHLLSQMGAGYGGEFASQSTSLWDIWRENLAFLPTHFGAALVGYPPVLLRPWYGLAFGLALLGLLRLTSRCSAACFTFCYLLLMLCWPFGMIRLVVPILPFLCLGLVASLPRSLPTGWRRGLLGLVLLAELFSLLAVRPPSRSSPAAEVGRLVGQIPAGRSVACETMDLGVFAGIPTDARPVRQKVERPWEWEQGLLDNRIGLVVLTALSQTHKGAFMNQAWLYRLVYESPVFIAFAFQPTPAQRRSLLLHSCARSALEQGRYATAEELFRRALRGAPRHSSIRSGWARTLAHLERPFEAYREAAWALQFDGQNQEARGLRDALQGFSRDLP
jgi:hypothetical protein